MIILGVILKLEKLYVILGIGEEIIFIVEVLFVIGLKGNVKIRFYRNDRVYVLLGNFMFVIFWKLGR